MKESTLQAGGLTFALSAGVLLIVGMWANDSCQRKANAAARDAAFDHSQLVTIEASLAFKKPEQKKRQPQKKRSAKTAPPPEVTLSRDADAPAKPPDKEPKEPPPPDYTDVLAKNRAIDTTEAPADGEVEDDTEGGSDDGSEWGTAADAKGDPYLGELTGRIQTVWNRPTLDSGKGVVRGCVKLDETGKIVERKVIQRSNNSMLNRSVEEALRKASDMETPVPPHLIQLLTKSGVCFDFKPGES